MENRVQKEKSSISSRSSSQQTLAEGGGTPSNRQSYTSMTTDYWTISKGAAIRTGFSCRECKVVINQGVTVRDGRKMRFFYHTYCYTGNADPRTQPNSSFHNDRFKNAIQREAPIWKGAGKWSVAQYGYNPNAAWK
ncbi:hypothetical protein BDR26DRAFT_546241 [Obelidium mucronatum]|nr:hypothetical protein BDR26DRAFT_546241 [Obelidium mucronatum]